MKPNIQAILTLVSCLILIPSALWAGSLCAVSVPSTQSDLSSEAIVHSCEAVSFVMAKGESEGIPLRFSSDQPYAQRRVSFQSNPAPGVSVELFKIGWVTYEKSGNLVTVPDPLVPISDGSSITLDNGLSSLLYVKITTTADSSGTIASPPLTVLVTETDPSGNLEQSTSSITLNVEIRNNLTLQKPSEMSEVIQASIWGSYETSVPEILRLLSKYRVNAAAGMTSNTNALRPSFGSESYNDILHVAFDELGFRRVSIPRQNDFSATKPFDTDGSRSVEQWAESSANYIKAVVRRLSDQSWSQKLSIKIWDEPSAKQYGQLRCLYDALRNRLKDPEQPCSSPLVQLELTERPHFFQGESIDIWIPYIKYLYEEDIQAIHARGKQAMVYANLWHGIDRASYSMRSIGWVLWRYKLDGYYLWAVNWWKLNEWETVSSSDDFFKRGTLIYRDKASGALYPCLRLEAFRDGLEDLLILKEVEKNAGASETLSALRVKAEKMRIQNGRPLPEDLGNWHDSLLRTYF